MVTYRMNGWTSVLDIDQALYSRLAIRVSSLPEGDDFKNVAAQS